MRKNLVDFCYVLTEHKQGETTLGEVGKNECPKSLVIWVVYWDLGQDQVMHSLPILKM